MEMNKETKILEWFFTAGVDDIAGDIPLNAYQAGKKKNISETNSALKDNIPSASMKSPVSFSKETTPTADDSSFLQTAQNLSAQAQTLEQLRENLQSFNGCALKKTATTTVFGTGPTNAPVMIIGEAPGADEDRQGLPFVGVSGQLLDKMLSFIGVSREKNAYISNIIPWRPPGNRKPSTLETDLCLPFILKHIELINPKVIVCVGGTSVTSLLRTEETITRVRGQWLFLQINGREIPVLPIFHPSFLLRSPIYKKTTWQDLLELKRKLRELNIV
jgi:uracil-DNA glycosylase